MPTSSSPRGPRDVTRRLAALVLAAGTLGLAGCAQGTVEAAPEAPAAVSEPIDGAEVARVTLVAEAATRLGIETSDVLKAGGEFAIPFGALLYDAAGRAWAYTNPEPLVYVREELDVLRVEDDLVYLSAGPKTGTPVVTVGAAELYGVESGIGGGH